MPSALITLALPEETHSLKLSHKNQVAGRGKQSELQAPHQYLTELLLLGVLADRH